MSSEIFGFLAFIVNARRFSKMNVNTGKVHDNY